MVQREIIQKVDAHAVFFGLRIKKRRRSIGFMDFCEKLPRSKKEFALFIAVISVLSVNIIAPLITSTHNVKPSA